MLGMPKIRSTGAALALIALVPLLGACNGTAKKADTTVAVTGTDTTCKPSATELKAGAIAFTFMNTSKLTNELYILGAKDRVVKEVENVLPGNTAHLTADLKAGSYTLACKPGQSGDGIKVPITVKGAGGATGSAAAHADRRIDLVARDYSFSFVAPLDVKKGEAIDFELGNAGKEHHEFEVLGPDGKSVGEISSVTPGGHGGATIVFAVSGAYTYQCMLQTTDGRAHSTLGMTGTFDVA